MDIFNRAYPLHVIKEKRREAALHLYEMGADIDPAEGTVTHITSADLVNLLQIYDRIFLEGWIEEHFKGQFKFSLSARMTRSAGLTKFPKNPSKQKEEDIQIEIKLSSSFIRDYENGKRVKVGGVETHSAIEVVQLIFEHELCHAIEFIEYHTSSCSRTRFKRLVYGLFGQSENVHQLGIVPAPTKDMVKLEAGVKAAFEFRGLRMIGTIISVKKRATILVPDKKGTYPDLDGNMCMKYYVPPHQLEKP